MKTGSPGSPALIIPPSVPVAGVDKKSMVPGVEPGYFHFLRLLGQITAQALKTTEKYCLPVLGPRVPE